MNPNIALWAPENKLHAIRTIVSKLFYGPISTVVETGTYRGEFTEVLSKEFGTVITIERSMALARAAQKKFRRSNVTVHLADSRDVLPGLCDSITEPCIWYLDAHAIPNGEGVGAHDHPLMQELEIVNKRSQPDVIVVDDVHAFGREEDRSDWSQVTVESILKAVDRVVEHEQVVDMFAMWRGDGR